MEEIKAMRTRIDRDCRECRSCYRDYRNYSNYRKYEQLQGQFDDILNKFRNWNTETPRRAVKDAHTWK